MSRGTSPAAIRTAARVERKVEVQRMSRRSWEEWNGGGGEEATRMVERERGRRVGLSWERFDSRIVLGV